MESPLKSENKSLLPNRSKAGEGSDSNADSKKRTSGGSNAEEASTNPEAQAELATAIDQLLETVGSKFTSMSKDIMTQMDIMAARLDELEAQARASIEAEKKRDSGAS